MRLRYLLDTNVVSQIASVPGDAVVLARLERHRSESCLCAPVLNELIFGYARLAPSRRRDALRRFVEEIALNLYPVLAYDAAAARWHAHERARLQRGGGAPPFVDGQIAAIAAVNDLVLVTHDRRGFAAFEGLALEDWVAESTAG